MSINSSPIHLCIHATKGAEIPTEPEPCLTSTPKTSLDHVTITSTQLDHVLDLGPRSNDPHYRYDEDGRREHVSVTLKRRIAQTRRSRSGPSSPVQSLMKITENDAYLDNLGKPNLVECMNCFTQVEPAPDYTKAAIRIQQWWRMKSMHLHFCRLKSRGSGSSESGVLDDCLLSNSKLHRSQPTASDPLFEHNAKCLDEFNFDPRNAVFSFLSTRLKNFSEHEKWESIVLFIARNRPHIDKNKLGELLGQPDATCMALMRSYINSLEFNGLDFTEALRHLLSHFRLPGEAQKIDRILDQFSVAYHVANPGMFKDAGTALVLAFSLIMLNTDAHNPAVKRKMTVNDFVRNNRGIDAGADLPAPLLRRLYFEIVCREISMNDDESVKTTRILRSLIGAEKIRSTYIGQFSASKVIRGSLHERKILLFATHLLISKVKYVGKYQVRQIYDLNSFGLISHCPADSHDNVFNTNMVTIQPIPYTGMYGDAGSSGSDPYLADIAYDQAVDLIFNSSEEREVFVLNIQSAVRAYMHNLGNAKIFVQDQVAATKANLERRYLTPKPATPTCNPPGLINVSEPVDIDSILSEPVVTSPDGIQAFAPGTQDVSPGSVRGTSLRAMRVSMQKDAVRVAQTFQHTRSVLHNRSRQISNNSIQDTMLGDTNRTVGSSFSCSSSILVNGEDDKLDSNSIRTLGTISDGCQRLSTNSSFVRVSPPKTTSCSPPSSRPSRATASSLPRSISIPSNTTGSLSRIGNGHGSPQSGSAFPQQCSGNNSKGPATEPLSKTGSPTETLNSEAISLQIDKQGHPKINVRPIPEASDQVSGLSGDAGRFLESPQTISPTTVPTSSFGWGRRRAHSYAK